MPSTAFDRPEKYRYMNGFNAFHETEVVPGVLPVAMNSPQKHRLGLYPEKLSGTSFTTPRDQNQQTWMYRVLPSCAHPPFEPREPKGLSASGDGNRVHVLPNQLRWDPFEKTGEKGAFPDCLQLLCTSGSPLSKSGLGIYVFTTTQDMDWTYYSADGDLLLVPQSDSLDIRTELGSLLVRPLEIAVIPRGIKWLARLCDQQPVRGYALELWEGHFKLPDLGPLGCDALACARDFQCPEASVDEGAVETPAPGGYKTVVKFGNAFFETTQAHTPFDVVAWRGNYYPYKYDLGRFNTMGSISYDHPDPSIFTVLTAPSATPGTAIADFVIFPPRWLVAEGTFRPPYYHRNCMSEFMGMICGEYDAKRAGAGGFSPGGASLHNIMSGHGPDADTYDAASRAELAPKKVGEGSMAFMFESCLMLGVTEWGLVNCKKVQPDYNESSWVGLKARFKLPQRVNIS